MTCPHDLPAEDLFFPGNHSSLVGYSDGDSILYDSSVLVRHISETHLREWGTQFEKAMWLSDDEILRHYDQLVRHRRHFEKLQKKTILGGGARLGPTQGGGRTMMVPGAPGGSNAAWIKLQELDLDAKNECFVNWHHMEVARQRFPKCVGLINGEPANLTPSPNLDPGLVRESSCPDWGWKGFSDEEATQCRADRGLATAGWRRCSMCRSFRPRRTSSPWLSLRATRSRLLAGWDSGRCLSADRAGVNRGPQDW